MINGVIKKIQLLPVNSRIILSTDYTLSIEQNYSQLNKGYKLTPSELVIDTISEDDLGFGDKGFVTVEFSNPCTEEDYSMLVRSIPNEYHLVVETFLYSDSNKNELYLTGDWSDIPEEEDTIRYSKGLENPFTQVTVFSDPGLLNFHYIIL